MNTLLVSIGLASSELTKSIISPVCISQQFLMAAYQSSNLIKKEHLKLAILNFLPQEISRTDLVLKNSILNF